MNSRIISAEAALLMPALPRDTEADEIARMIDEARRARDAAIAARVTGFFHGLRATLHDWLARRETIHQLRGLTDRELADIGLSRAGILAAAASLPSPANDVAKLRQAA
ncbi:DUF1127 domain-containing protein [Roseococcus pinisoli]|uniref:DUF1127 domain-containing protein n=1 Tax=Roseococcus pinisoli TaxID=2835040 RepID=A0ABS5QJ89_9PROT|nr:DUF1127 domain-containing protein [Roseococcus pinisoli]MBS7813568.1 DUF1127 domain-containing protein [Roseococcus pinisoli]